MEFSLVADGLWIFDLGVWLTIFKVVVGLGAVIFVHELGHFLAAKSCGVKCEKFYVGFDVPIQLGWGENAIKLPSALFKKQWGETEYGIGIIPLGGYVKMLGQDDNPAGAAKERERSRISGEEHGDSAGGDSARGEFAEQGDAGEGDFQLDPRSYMAKNVPQRMLIISAGVIMNLIFAVIFAAIAYRVGVEYTPCVVGKTIPGEPAYTVGLQPGVRILQIGRDGLPKEHLRFDKDLMEEVLFAEPGKDIDLLIRRPDGQEEWVTIAPEQVTRNGFEISQFGVAAAATNKLAPEKPIFEDFPLYAAAKPADDGDSRPLIRGGEEIIGLISDGERRDIADYFALQKYLANHPANKLTFVFRRTRGDDKGDEFQVDAAPTPRRRLGLVMKIGPVSSVRKGSPADAAGLKSGDMIRKVGGREQLDPTSLDGLFLEHVGETVEVEVLRDGEEKTLSITPEPPEIYLPRLGEDQHLPITAIGVTFEVRNEIAGVVPDSPAAGQNIKAGDKLLWAQFIAADEKKAKIEKEQRGLIVDQKIDFEHDEQNWALLLSRMLWSLRDTKVKLRLEAADGSKKEVTLQPVDADGFPTEHQAYTAARGLRLQQLTEINAVEDWGSAFALGLRETKESVFKVLSFLQKLVTGRIPVTALGGPVTIAYVAGTEATIGWSRLLIFLTLLSANLAVINFLPIPVLDGGHFLFLVIEGIRGKPLDDRWAVPISVAGLIFLLGLMLFVISLDLMRFLL